MVKRVFVIVFTLLFLFLDFMKTGDLGRAQAASVKLSNTTVTLEAGRYRTLTVLGTKSRVVWTSGNKAVAVVSSGGKVTAKAVGTTTVYAKVGGKKLAAKIKVIKPIKLNTTSLSLKIGQTKILKITGTSGKIKWSTSKSSVASITSSGKVIAKAAGTAIIYASVTGKKLSCKISVSKNTDASKPKQPSTSGTTGSGGMSIQTPLITPIPGTTATETAATDRKVVGYYAAWARYSGFTPSDIDTKKVTHINYAFANIGSDSKITLGYPDIDEANIRELNRLKEENPNLKTIIAVGGWSWSARFSDISLTEANRLAFADSCIAFIKKYGFNGIDIDWEYPVSGGLSTNINRPEDKQNFTLLMKTLREKLDILEKAEQRQYLLSYAGAAGDWYLKNTEPEKLNQYVDYVNLMTYDIHGVWEQTTDFNAPLYKDSTSPGAQYKTSVDLGVSGWIEAGFPKDKLIMGVPFYGYIYKAVDNRNQGLYQRYSGGASISYANIAANYLKVPGYERFFHSQSRVPWLFNGSTYLSYEDEQSMTEKARYIKEKQLGGVMIWELSQDPNRILLSALYEELHK